MKIANKRARFDYELFEKFETGIALNGGEAKAVRTGHVNLTNSYAKIIGNEIYLVNANIPVSGKLNYDPARSRKLLLHRQEILEIQTKIKQKKLTIVPVSVYTTRNLVKIEIALAKSKRKFEKRQTLKKRDIQREIKGELK